MAGSEKQKILFESFQYAFPKFFGDYPNIISFYVPPGWVPLVWRLCKELDQNFDVDIKVDQVKQKFGELRFYYTIKEETSESETIRHLVDGYMFMSRRVCEECGTVKNVRTNKKGHITTKCDGCRKCPTCTPVFDLEKAKSMSPSEIRKKYPRWFGECDDCGYYGIGYASSAHYVYGDW